MEENLQDIGFTDDFLDMTPKAQTTKVKTDKLDFIKIENFWSSFRGSAVNEPN